MTKKIISAQCSDHSADSPGASNFLQLLKTFSLTWMQNCTWSLEHSSLPSVSNREFDNLNVETSHSGCFLFLVQSHEFDDYLFVFVVCVWRPPPPASPPLHWPETSNHISSLWRPAVSQKWVLPFPEVPGPVFADNGTQAHLENLYHSSAHQSAQNKGVCRIPHKYDHNVNSKLVAQVLVAICERRYDNNAGVTRYPRLPPLHSSRLISIEYSVNFHHPSPPRPCPHQSVPTTQPDCHERTTNCAYVG